jgi:Leucine-rich repeat (LRR) protein/fibronectin type 3 domain-containing protein
MNCKSKLLALFLAVALLVGALPLAALAATDITAQITDANLLQAIRDRLGKSAGDPVTDDDMASIIDLNAYNRGITSLAGLQYATSLQELFANDNSISDLTPLTNLTSLKRLNLWNNDIADIAPLSGLTGLERLDLNTNSVSDLTPLSGKTSLQVLSLYGNSITDISALGGLPALSELLLDGNPGITDYSPLAGLTNLHTLSLNNNGITSVSVLSPLTNLTWLCLEGNQISDISPLSGMANMQRLALSTNAIEDISALANMPDLWELMLYTNQISDISPLSGLTNLTYLDLYNNRIKNVSPLSGLTNLTELYINKNRISDIRPLNTLIANDSALTRLYMGYNYLNLTAGVDYQGQAYAAAATIAVLNARGIAIGNTTTTQYDLASTPFAAQAAHTSASVTLSWDPIPNTNCGVARSGEDGVSVTFIGRYDGNRATTYTDNTVVPNCSYVYTILADIYRGDSSVVEPVHLSQTVAVTTDTDPSMTDPVFTVQPKSTALSYGNTARFSVYAISPNAGTLAYQWQVSSDGGLTWNDVTTGGTDAAYRTAALSAADNGAMYRCAVTNTKGGTSGTTHSNPATVTMSAYSAESDFYFYADANAIYDYLGSSEVVNIPPAFGGTPVTTIASGAFSYCNTITRVVVPSGVTTVDMQAFYNCPNLRSISLPNSLNTLGQAVFMYDTALTSITIPPSITHIGDSTFMYASSLSRILFLGAPPTLGSQVFFGVPGPIKVNYYADNTAFAAAVSGGKWNGFDAVPLVTVTYDANGATGGDVPTDTGVYEPGQSATVAGNTGGLTKDDLVFAGWNTVSDGSGVHYAAGANLPIDGAGNVILYAEWIEIPVITTTSLPGGVFGLPYSQALASDGTMPIAWTIVAGSLPAGLSLNVAAGVISGTPSVTGTFAFTVQATNSAGYAFRALNITISASPSITTSSLPDGGVGVPYSQTLASDGTAPITWTVIAGALPVGLSLNTNGVISGTPSVTGTFAFTVQAHNTVGDDSQALSINVYAPPSITTLSLPDGAVGAPYSQTLAADGTAPITWTVIAGVLPDGLSLDMNGVISGTPVQTGTLSFSVQAHNTLGDDSQILSINIYAPPSITTLSLPDGAVGAPYSQTLAADGTAPITWLAIAGDLPAGLSLDTDTGVISGTPTTADTYNFTVRATNSVGIGIQSLSITIDPAPTVTGVTVTPSTASVLKGGSQAFTAVVEGEDDPAQTVTWTVTGGISGTAINASGMLTVAADETAATLTVTATSTVDTSKSGSATVTVTSPTPTPTAAPTLAPTPTPTPVAKYTITAESNNTAYGTVSGGGKFASGASVTLSAKPKAGYRFVRWLEGSKAVSASAQYTFTVAKARTLKAEFAKAASPKDAQAVSAGYDRIKITWKAVSGAKEYEVYRAASKNGTYTKAGVCADTSFISTGLTMNKAYFFKVRARYVAGSTVTLGGYSDIVSDKPVPATPSGIKGSVASFNSVRLTWKEVPGATKYAVYRAVNKNGYYARIAETSSLTYTDKGLTHKKTYYYKVRAYRLAGKTKVFSSYSGIVTAKPILGTPANVKAVRTPDVSIKVKWDAVSGADGYDVYRAESKTGEFVLIGSVTGRTKTLYNDTDAKDNRTYYYQVKAYLMAGGKKQQSPFSKITPLETVK